MSEENYQLCRARSVSAVRTTSDYSPSTRILNRTYSVPDLSAYYRLTSEHRPYYRYLYNPSSYSYDIDDYWQGRNRSWRRYGYSNNYPYYYSSPYHRSYPYNYWWRYKSYLYDSDYPYYYRRYVDPYYDAYLKNLYYKPYTSVWSDTYTPSLYNRPLYSSPYAYRTYYYF